MRLVIKPPRHLSNFIRYYLVMNSDPTIDDSTTLEVFADVYPRMIIQHNNGISGFSTAREQLPISYVSGIKSKPLTLHLNTKDIILISFFPDALKVLFQYDACDFINDHLDLSNFAPKDLTEKIISSDDITQKVTLLNAYFTQQLQNSNFSSDSIIRNAIGWFNRDESGHRVGSFLKIHPISERQLERRFQQYVGISFQSFLRIQRFEKAFNLLKDTTHSLGDIAFLSNYSDQSHFAREFKDFTGFAPHSFRKKEVFDDEGNAILTK